jgi:glycosyltransferase involved in cell wall biosynthesis
MALKGNPATVVFDISRTITGVSQGFVTGIDRVERAYLEHFLESQRPVLFLVRFNRRSALLTRQSMRELYKLIQKNGPWDKPGIGALLGRRKYRKSAHITNTVRRLSLSWPFLGRGLKAHAPAGFIYLNVGHEKLWPSLWPKLRRSGAGKIVAMIHDLIPIDFPQFTAPKNTAKFGVRMKALTHHADYFIYNSTDTEQRMQHWFKKWGTSVDGRVFLLGTDPLPYTDGPSVAPLSAPYFVCLSTIEPRKNHKLLLDIWAELHDTMPESEIPHLHIVGKRGWLNEDVFDTLDTAPFMGKTVFEHGQISDAQLGPLMKGARALLFPSFTEGFGYPLVESLQMQVPVICSDLPCFHEIAGDAAIYIDIKNRHEWVERILDISTSNVISNQLAKTTPKLPNWDMHFHKIDTILDDIS